MKRVVVTGMGLVSPLGDDVEEVFSAVLAGESGVVAVPRFEGIDSLGVRLGAPVRRHDPAAIPRKFRRSMARMTQYAVSAAATAFQQAGLPAELAASGRLAICAGSTTGSPEAMEAFFLEYLTTRSIRGVPSTAFLKVMSHTVASHLALVYGVTGTVLSPCCACAASNQAVGLGLDLLRAGRADVVLCGGADELSVLSAATFDVVGAASRGHAEAPRRWPAPFDRRRDGVVVGEGAAMVVLETEEHARARGAKILGEILGYGESCDASHMSSPAPAGMRLAMERSLRDAGIGAGEVEWVNAHATGTQVGDAAEASATAEVFGDRVPVSSLKGHFGHTLAACGVIELIVSLRAMALGVVPPTLNLEDPDVAPLLLPREPLERRLRCVMTNNFAFGGINASLVVGARA